MTVQRVSSPSLHLCRDTYPSQQYSPVVYPVNYSSPASQAQTHEAIIHSWQIRSAWDSTTGFKYVRTVNVRLLTSVTWEKTKQDTPKYAVSMFPQSSWGQVPFMLPLCARALFGITIKVVGISEAIWRRGRTHTEALTKEKHRPSSADNSSNDEGAFWHPHVTAFCREWREVSPQAAAIHWDLLERFFKQKSFPLCSAHEPQSLDAEHRDFLGRILLR